MLKFSIFGWYAFCSKDLTLKHQLLKLGEGVSEDLANYMSMALDPSAGNTADLMSQQIPNYREGIENLERELQEKLTAKNVTILELFHKIAIRW